MVKRGRGRGRGNALVGFCKGRVGEYSRARAREDAIAGLSGAFAWPWAVMKRSAAG